MVLLGFCQYKVHSTQYSTVNSAVHNMLPIDIIQVQFDQLNITVCFWYLVKRDLSSVRYYTVAYTSVTFYKVPEQHGYVYLVGLYAWRFSYWLYIWIICDDIDHSILKAD